MREGTVSRGNHRLCLGVAGTLLLILAAAGWAQGVIENPAKPKAANAGRVIAPEQVAVISGEGTSAYYFKWPGELRTGHDGGLILNDENQILEFDANGKFVLNLFKKGQGPGEMTYAGTCLAAGTGFVVYSPNVRKLVHFDASGRFTKEVPVRPEGRTMMNFLHYLDGTAYFEAGEFPRTTGDPDFVDNPRTIVAVNEPDGAIKKLSTFVTRSWVVTTAGGGGGMFDVSRLNAVPFKDRLLALTHTEEYLIKIYDPAADKVLRQFRRPYERVKGKPLTETEKKGGLFINGKHYPRPEREFENDIQNILTCDGEIWAVTSMEDKAKGVFIDVFDGDGTYRDCFWLRLPEAGVRGLAGPGQCVLDGEFLWVVEQAEDGTYSIKKYEVGSSQAETLRRELARQRGESEGP